MVLASAVILGSKTRGTRDCILLSQIRDSPNLEAQVPLFISPRNREAQLYPRHSVPFSSSPTTPSLRWRYSNPPPRGVLTAVFNYSCQSQSQSYVTTDSQSVSVSWNKTPVWGLRPDFYYCHTVAGLLMWGALSDERAVLSFARLSQQ
jgi:hypothetical protein